MYTYEAKLVRVVDGDSIRADISLGFSIWRMNEPLRLARINAPEPRGETREAGLLARDELNRFLGDRDLVVHTIKNKRGEESKGSFSRYLAEVFILVGDAEFNVSDWMVSQSLAVYQNY